MAHLNTMKEFQIIEIVKSNYRMQYLYAVVCMHGEYTRILDTVNWYKCEQGQLIFKSKIPQLCVIPCVFINDLFVHRKWRESALQFLYCSYIYWYTNVCLVILKSQSMDIFFYEPHVCWLIMCSLALYCRMREYVLFCYYILFRPPVTLTLQMLLMFVLDLLMLACTRYYVVDDLSMNYMFLFLDFGTFFF